MVGHVQGGKKHRLVEELLPEHRLIPSILRHFPQKGTALLSCDFACIPEKSADEAIAITFLRQILSRRQAGFVLVKFNPVHTQKIPPLTLHFISGP